MFFPGAKNMLKNAAKWMPVPSCQGQCGWEVWDHLRAHGLPRAAKTQLEQGGAEDIAAVDEVFDFGGAVLEPCGFWVHISISMHSFGRARAMPANLLDYYYPMSYIYVDI